ncbi:MAG: SH3 domain-containing protein [Alteraurantiacibacter sp.]
MTRSATLAALAMLFAAPAAAQEAEDLPYWASISAEEANMRVGAGERFPIQWVYTRPGLPVKVVRFHQGWRLVEEPDGTRGWIFRGLLSTTRTAIVTGEGLTPMRETGSDGAALRWNLEPGVIGEVGACEAGWCEFDVTGHRGWVQQDRLWGAGEP